MSDQLHVSNRAISWNSLWMTMSQREDTPLLRDSESSANRTSNIQDANKQDIWSHRWIPGFIEEDDRPTDVVRASQARHKRRRRYHHRSVRRRIFLFLTDPTSSYASVIFFIILVIAITAINILMFMQTMNQFQFVPDDCYSCGGTKYYVLEDDSFVIEKGVPCVCPPAPIPATVKASDWIVYFFTVEWCMRVLFFEPPPAERASTCWGFFCQWLGYLTDTTTILDALAIFPYYAERFEKANGLMSLRLLRLFRVFQLVRLGQYNSSFMSLTNVLYRSVLYLKLLIVVLLFGAAFFGSIVYWLEKGDWKYYEETESYEFLRKSVDGLKLEPTPFTSIPAAFWWFMVTATTVGYGDMYPTTDGGRCVAAMAMLMGVLVIAFPVSVFSDLWSNELKQRGVDYEGILVEDDDDDDGDETDLLPKNDLNRSVRFSDEAAVSDESFSSEGTDDVHPSPAMRFSERTEQSVMSIPEEGVVLDADDVAALTKHMRMMEKSQKKIRGILAKYDIET